MRDSKTETAKQNKESPEVPERGGRSGRGRERAGRPSGVPSSPAAWEPPARASQLLASAETVLTTCSTLFPPSTPIRPSKHNSAAVSSRKPSLTGLKLAQLPSRIPGFQALQSPTRVLPGPAFRLCNALSPN